MNQISRVRDTNQRENEELGSNSDKSLNHSKPQYELQTSVSRTDESTSSVNSLSLPTKSAVDILERTDSEAKILLGSLLEVVPQISTMRFSHEKAESIYNLLSQLRDKDLRESDEGSWLGDGHEEEQVGEVGKKSVEAETLAYTALKLGASLDSVVSLIKIIKPDRVDVTSSLLEGGYKLSKDKYMVGFAVEAVKALSDEYGVENIRIIKKSRSFGSEEVSLGDMVSSELYSDSYVVEVCNDVQEVPEYKNSKSEVATLFSWIPFVSPRVVTKETLVGYQPKKSFKAVLSVSKNSIQIQSAEHFAGVTNKLNPLVQALEKRFEKNLSIEVVGSGGVDFAEMIVGMNR